MERRRATQLSKRLSLVLRHDPSSIGVALDVHGWAPVDALLLALAAHGAPLTREELLGLVRTSDKQRFVLDPAGDRIRANQGHSVSVDLDHPVVAPPTRLFHGTVARALLGIRRDGIVRGARHAVHLSDSRETAARVGGRRGTPVVLGVLAARMARDGHVFQLSPNGVWLVAHVPSRYLEIPG